MQQQNESNRGFSPFQFQPIEQTLQTFQWFSMMRANQPVYHDEQSHLWHVFRYEDVTKVVTDYSHFSSESIPGFSENSFLNGTVVAKDPPDHRKLRNLVNQAFTPRAVNHLSGRVTEIAQELIDGIKPAGTMDVISDIAFPFPAKVIAELLGVPDKDWDIFRRWASGGEGVGSEVSTEDNTAQGQQSMEENMYDFFSRLLAERRESPREDLISSLSVAEIDGERLSERELVSFCILLLAAGQETTKNLIANAMYLFTEYPEVAERLRQEPALMPAAIEEILRFLPPVWFTIRRATEDVQIGGQTIPANSIVMAWNSSANRDAAQFPDPDTFNIQRDPNRHLTFGHGIHFCIGAPLARLEGKVILPMLLEQLKDIKRVPDVPINVRAGIVYVIQSLPVTFSH
ncbi:putative cytochrome P450 YjiB [Dictyobacter alpinus]|uniref:Putative cytochrome P450 YjiB n=1 Tax=Dictyobacter alpinus TaxID=2014873 RepID=A0A402BCT5_9CHLR|nr:cytochrome P450 [Dictyobacter alpinus]GCE29144.1 putative cytochrome P450 YjiB [Dictyobacter alpinus]